MENANVDNVADNEEPSSGESKDFGDVLKDLGVAPGVMTELVAGLVNLVKGDEFPKDEKWIERVKKSLEPLDVEDRVKSQLYTSARKELDTKAMDHYRKTGEIMPVTEEDIAKLFKEKWETHLAKKAKKDAKKKALSKASN